jgi:hypothetical protein
MQRPQRDQSCSITTDKIGVRRESNATADRPAKFIGRRGFTFVRFDVVDDLRCCHAPDSLATQTERMMSPEQCRSLVPLRAAAAGAR